MALLGGHGAEVVSGAPAQQEGRGSINTSTSRSSASPRRTLDEGELVAATAKASSRPLSKALPPTPSPTTPLPTCAAPPDTKQPNASPSSPYPTYPAPTTAEEQHALASFPAWYRALLSPAHPHRYLTALLLWLAFLLLSLLVVLALPIEGWYAPAVPAAEGRHEELAREWANEVRAIVVLQIGLVGVPMPVWVYFGGRAWRGWRLRRESGRGEGQRDEQKAMGGF